MTNRGDERQQMADMAQLYCREAVADISDGYWFHACAHLLERCRRLDMALQSLTPGGSEYVGEPEHCVLHVRRQIDKYRDTVRDCVLKTS